MSGWIKIHREITKHWIWCDAERLKWWLDLLMNAAYEDRQELVGKQLITLRPGQIVASVASLCKRWRRSRMMVAPFLRMLEDEQMIVKKVDKNISIITISNYDKYQVNDAHLDTQYDVYLNSDITDDYKDIDAHLDTHLDTHIAKKEKDIKEKNIKRNSSSTLNAHAREKELYDKLKKSEIWIEQVAMKFRVPIERIVSEIDDFALDCDCRGKEHNRLNDTKQHFCDWLRLKIERENNVTDKSKSENKRRGTEVTATSWQDYEGAF